MSQAHFESLDHLILRWSRKDRPLPVRHLRSTHAHGHTLLPPPPWMKTGSTSEPFDFCERLRPLLADIARRCEDLRHIDVAKILLAMTPARNGRRHGLQARVTPLRFHDGQLTRERRGVLYQVQRFFDEEHEFLYLMTFCLPRFLNQSFDDKFVTIFHELFHISPKFDGDLRRHGGRYELHTHSQCGYDRHMAHLARAYLATKPDPDLHAFLRLDFAQLCQRHGSVAGIVVPRPKVFPVPRTSSWAAHTR